MSKPASTPQKQDALEIIELATDDLQTLAKAFDLITEVCKEFEQPNLTVAEDQDTIIQ